MRIMGVDPSLSNTGYAIIDEKYTLLDHGVIKTSGGALEDRLFEIHETLRGKIDEWQPDYFVMEDTFYHRNPDTAIKLGAVKGVCLLAARRSGVRILTLTPTTVKLSITGDGRANKEKVAFMVNKILKLDVRFPSHVSDAIACAIAAVHKLRKDALFNKR